MMYVGDVCTQTFPYFEISRTFRYKNLPTAKQNVCFESYVLGINMCTCRDTRK